MRKPILGLLVFFLVPGLALADVTYEEETKMGGLMAIMSLGKATKSVTRVSGNFMRTDNGNDATIVDLDGEKVLTLDTKKKTYSVMTFEQMKKKMEEALAAVQGKEAEGAKEGQESAQPSDVSASTDVRVTDTGRTEAIQGLECKQYLLELDVTLTNEKEKESGTLSTVTEMWLAKNVPGAEEVNAFNRKMAEKIGTTSVARQWTSGAAEAQKQPFGADMQKMADEMKKMEGHAMRSVMYFGSAEAAKQEAMGQKRPDEGEGGGGIGGLGGLLKKMKPIGNEEPEENPEGGEGTQGGVMMKITTETKKIDTNPVDPKVFAVPGDYKLVESK
ncbi:MAG: hypothetical protein ACRD21_01945 [Vicinamibacteria bacterium]